uniref:Uncharacterized protein n=3 Tax=Oryza TaxID=4527 RepID=A0A0D3F4M4_9ORYZ
MIEAIDEYSAEDPLQPWLERGLLKSAGGDLRPDDDLYKKDLRYLKTKSGTSAFMDFTARQFHSPKSVVQSNKCKTSPLMNMGHFANPK